MEKTDCENGQKNTSLTASFLNGLRQFNVLKNSNIDNFLIDNKF
jgi:hypothetical protein